MEMNLLQKKKRLRGKLPDIQICLGIKVYSISSLKSLLIFYFRYDQTTS